MQALVQAKLPTPLCEISFLVLFWWLVIRAETIIRVTRIIQLQKNGQSKISASRLGLIPITYVMCPAYLRDHFSTVIADTHHYLQTQANVNIDVG